MMGLLDLLGGGYSTDPNAARGNAGPATSGGLLGADLYGDVLTPEQKRAVAKRRLAGFSQAIAPYLGYSLDPGKVGSTLQVLNAGLGGMGEAEDSAALNALRAGQLGLQQTNLKSQLDIRNKLMAALPGLLGGSAGTPAGAASLPGPDGAPRPQMQPGGGMSAGGALDFPALRQIAEQAGFKGQGADIMAATSLAESGGNPNAVGDGGKSFGLTQIHEPAHGPVAREALGNPLRAMQLAYAVSKGGADFSPWTMFKNGDYQKYLPASGGGAQPVQLAQAGPIAPGVLGAGQGPSGPMDVEARYNDAVRRGDTVRAQQILRGEAPPTMPAPQAAPAPAGGVLAPGGMSGAPAPQTAPAGSAAAPGVPGTGLNPRALATAGVLGQLGGLPDVFKPLEQFYYNSPEHAAQLEAAKRGTGLNFLPQEKAIEARAKYLEPAADVALQGQLAGAQARAKYLEPGADPALQGQIKGAQTTAERAVTEPSDIRINQAKEGYQQVPMPGGGYNLQPILGSQPARAQAEQKGQQTLQGSLTNRAIDRALDLSSHWTTGALGSALSAVPGTPAHDLATTLDTLRAQSSFTNLQQLRQASPTGGALGAVSDFENRMLQATWNSLAQSQSKTQFESNLHNLRQVFDYTINGVPGLRDQLQQGQISREQYDAALLKRLGTGAAGAPAQSGVTSSGVKWRVQ